MADNIRRAMQDITLGSEDPPFVLPAEVVRQAEEENRFILVGHPVMPRRQNLRALLATMPRNWGFEGLVRGRVIEGRRFQFVFPSEESMDMVIRRGPWAFADRMIVLQRWTPLMDMEMLNYIPFWIQIRGIPLQYMNRQVIVNIARLLGEYIQMDYSEEIGNRLEYVRVRLNWNVNHPLRFQRNFQFVPGVNTLLRLQYERLRGFCEVRGLITHDSGACLIQNGGPDNDDGAHNGDEEDDDIEIVPNQGVAIEEINEEVNEGVVADGNEAAEENVEPLVEEEDPEQEEYERNIRILEGEADDEKLWSGNGMQTMFTSDVDRDEMYNVLYPNGQRFPKDVEEESGHKRKSWLSGANENTLKFSKGERGESSDSSKSKRKKSNEAASGEQVTHDGTVQNGGERGESRDSSKSKRKKSNEAASGEQVTHDGTVQNDSNTVRGAVGPEPPLPP
ncbi:PREDICTED: uncharacterized protein LOC106335497 [Brassica oleracea var. oleracea]|uniref:uncharacterized protein LOC106335497 n=1 Tax=Brassica oleracea var. oleracea TaxID=109376 RepID=UPI0006A6E305|nr:PREDICTED: uncharacterized protein LOC106335497 [Brassica oleracea var. oleracea]